MIDNDLLARNKAAVQRFNHAFIAQGDMKAFEELMDPRFINRTALPGFPPGADGMVKMIVEILRAAFPDISVEIHDQIAEGDKVFTRKTLSGTHRGEFLGVPATGRRLSIQVFDLVRLENGRYVEHWGLNTVPLLAMQLKAEMAAR